MFIRNWILRTGLINLFENQGIMETVIYDSVDIELVGLELSFRIMDAWSKRLVISIIIKGFWFPVDYSHFNYLIFLNFVSLTSLLLSLCSSFFLPSPAGIWFYVSIFSGIHGLADCSKRRSPSLLRLDVSLTLCSFRLFSNMQATDLVCLLKNQIFVIAGSPSIFSNLLCTAANPLSSLTFLSQNYVSRPSTFPPLGIYDRVS